MEILFIALVLIVFIACIGAVVAVVMGIKTGTAMGRQIKAQQAEQAQKESRLAQGAIHPRYDKTGRDNNGNLVDTGQQDDAEFARQYHHRGHCPCQYCVEARNLHHTKATPPTA